MLPDSFQPYYLLDSVQNIINMATSGTTANIVNTPGLVGIFNTPIATGVYGAAVGSAGTSASCIIAVGSWHTKDKIAALWGGLQEPEYTQIIDWKKVYNFQKTVAQAAQNQVVTFGWNQSSGSTTGPTFLCGTVYNLYIEAQGNPVLHFLNHQFYTTFSAVGACCTTDCSSGCTASNVDAACIMLQWKDGISQNPYWPTFVTPNVYIQNGASKTEVFSAYDTANGVGNGTYTCNTSTPTTVIATMQLTVAYADTTFGTCTFSPTDYFGIEPLIISTVSLVNQDASPCAVNTTINSSVPNMFTELTAPRQVRGLGQQVVRNLLNWANYRQEYFPDGNWTMSLRMREIENFTQLTDVSLSGLYDSIILRFNMTRPWNYSSFNNNDAYCLTFYVPTGTTTTNFTGIINNCLTAAGNSVQLITV